MAWEYRKCLDFGELEALGREGWELVAVLPAGTEAEAIFYLKRPAPNFRERVTEEQKRHYYRPFGVSHHTTKSRADEKERNIAPRHLRAARGKRTYRLYHYL